MTLSDIKASAIRGAYLAISRQRQAGDKPMRFEDVACTTVHYGAWNSGTRTIYETPTPLWEEVITSGHPSFGSWEVSWTVFPKTAPAELPAGATDMGVDDHGFGPFNWVSFTDENAAFEYAMQPR